MRAVNRRTSQALAEWSLLIGLVAIIVSIYLAGIR